MASSSLPTKISLLSFYARQNQAVSIIRSRSEAMASVLFSAQTFTSPAVPKSGVLAPSYTSFHGLRPLKPTDASFSSKSRAITARCCRAGARTAIARAELNTSLVISLSTGLSLFLGRFVFFNFQRENVAKQGLPEQNGLSHFEAGDSRAKEYAGILKSNDPVGFNIIDVLAWGSLGHIVAYYILATSSNGYDPNFFG